MSRPAICAAIESVAAVTKMDVVPGRTGGELRHVEDADLDRARRVEPLQHGGGGRRDLILQDLASAGGDLAGAIEHVLVGERHAVQRTAALPALEFAVTFARGVHSGFARRSG